MPTRTVRPTTGHRRLGAALLLTATLALSACSPTTSTSPTTTQENSTLSLGSAFRTFHVYAQPGTASAMVKSWLATFGGSAAPPVTTDLTPLPSKAEATMVFSAVAPLSVYDFQTPVPFPFGQEISGWGVTDVDQGVRDAVAAGASVVVAPFNDPIGRDAVVQFPGGAPVQLWHLFDLPKSFYPPLIDQPDLRFYVPQGSVDGFVRSYLSFTKGQVTSDNPKADGAQIGVAGTTYRRITTTSTYGNTVVIGNDGHLPYPFGREAGGISVKDLTATLAKANQNGASVIWGPYTAPAGHSAIVEFPGGLITEIHDGQLR